MTNSDRKEIAKKSDRELLDSIYKDCDLLDKCKLKEVRRSLNKRIQAHLDEQQARLLEAPAA